MGARLIGGRIGCINYGKKGDEVLLRLPCWRSRREVRKRTFLLEIEIVYPTCDMGLWFLRNLKFLYNPV